MSTNARSQGPALAANAPEKSFFETQRGILLSEIEKSFEAVLASINKLNRSLEGVIAVGNEFSSVEALWSQFETVRAKDPDAEQELGTEGTEGRRSRSEKGGDAEGESSMEEA